MGVGCWDMPVTADHLLVFCLWLDGVVICLQGSSCPRQFVVMVAKLLHDKYHGGCINRGKGMAIERVSNTFEGSSHLCYRSPGRHFACVKELSLGQFSSPSSKEKLLSPDLQQHWGSSL